MHEYLIHINTEENRQEAKKLFRAMEMMLPVKIKGKWYAVKSIQTNSHCFDVTEIYTEGFPPFFLPLFLAAITPYHTKRSK